MISLNDITVSFGGLDLFKQISFLVSAKERVGLVGKNGAGKTTLLRLIAGQMSPTEGNINISKELGVGYLPQQMEMNTTRNVLDETMLAFHEALSLQKEIGEITKAIEQRTDYESDEYAGLINSLAVKSERFALLGGDTLEARAEVTLQGLGFKRTDFGRPTAEFSHGWQMRIELAKILLSNPDILLLDEPTNHLDIESIQWLEDYLKTFAGALILVSHDRAFLDNVTQRTIELSLGRLYDYRVSYSKFVELRRERREQQMAAYKNQQKQIDDTMEFVERFRYKATKANQVQSRLKQLDKMEIIEVDEEDMATLNIRFPEAPRSGDLVVDVDGVSKSYGDHEVFGDAAFHIMRGEKVAFVGRNGEGKTTLARIIVGDLDYQGELKIGHNVSIGYSAQNQGDLLDNNLTVLETIDRVAVGDIRTKMRDILGAFLFRGDDVDKRVSVLSGGERNRLAMVRLMLEPYNLLILDEPTNHLDMRSKEILKTALLNFKGTVIVVSHDRDFLNGLVSKVYEFRDGSIKEHLGGIYDFLERRRLQNLNELERKRVEEKEQNQDTEISQAKQDWLDRKEQDRARRRVENQVKSVEKEIAGLEEEISKLDEILMKPQDSEKPMDDDFFIGYNHKKNSLEKAMHRWEELVHRLDEME